MPSAPRFPTLYQINTRIWLRGLSRRVGHSATFDEVSDSYLDSLSSLGFDWLWPIGVWQTGEAARQVSRSQEDWREGFRQALPDLTDDDITGSPFAITHYTVNKEYGGDDALRRLRERLRLRGIKLLLGFVPNHTAPDHPWVWEHPEFYIAGDAHDLNREPQKFLRVETKQGPRILAYGRDPYFSSWRDTLQLNYRSRALRQAMTAELGKIAERCDGVRCDMAMLLLPDVIQRTWGDRSLPTDNTPPIDTPFWPEAIASVRAAHSEFTFMAEVYWDCEWELQKQGFDLTYDKRLYDRLRDGETHTIRGHLGAEVEFQGKSVHFLENHDEPRAARVFSPEMHRAAAIIAYLIPGMRFFHEGQLEGRREHVSMHLGRRPVEAIDNEVRSFYSQLLGVLKNEIVRDGEWQLLGCLPAWDGNATCSQFVAFAWQGKDGSRWLVVVNYGPAQAQCYIPLPWPEIAGRTILLRDRMSEVYYERLGSDLQRRGLYLDMSGWQYHVFEVK